MVSKHRLSLRTGGLKDRFDCVLHIFVVSSICNLAQSTNETIFSLTQSLDDSGLNMLVYVHVLLQ